MPKKVEPSIKFYAELFNNDLKINVNSLKFQIQSKEDEEIYLSLLDSPEKFFKENLGININYYETSDPTAYSCRGYPKYLILNKGFAYNYIHYIEVVSKEIYFRDYFYCKELKLDSLKKLKQIILYRKLTQK